MRRLLGYFVVLTSFLLCMAHGSVSAATPTTITVGPTPPANTSPGLIITSLVGSALPDYFELYNQADTPLNLDGWAITFTLHDTDPLGCGDPQASVSLPNAWLLTKKYSTLERTNSPAPGSTSIPFSIDPTILDGCIAAQLSAVAIIGSTGEPEQFIAIPADKWSPVAVTVAQHKQRSNSPSSTRVISGDFNTDYKIVTGAITLNSDQLYTPPADTAGLQVVEILPHARSCSPLDTNLTCNDYIKLFNPTNQPINLAAYRLRVGYKGQSESVTNTFTWGHELDPSQDELILPALSYLMLAARNDGQPISITDSGNFVWMEDAYGTTMYEPVIAYPDASSTTKVGYAWAYDGSGWQWTSAPQPNAPNYFPPVTVPASQDQSSVSVSVLKPCSANQYRNPDTNRCKSIVLASASLAPCGVGQERNPATNRCRSIVAASASLVPCQPGWQRNPETNRCRKLAAAVAGASTTKIEDNIAPTSDSPMGWYIATIAIVSAVAYAGYEWRQEIALGTLRLKSKAKGFLPRHSLRHKKQR